MWPINHPLHTPQKVFHRFRSVVTPLQFLFQGRKRMLPKSTVKELVLLQILVADGFHISLLVRKMVHRVFFERFDALLACPLAVLFLFLKGEQLVDDLKEPLVLLINHVYSYI